MNKKTILFLVIAVIALLVGISIFLYAHSLDTSQTNQPAEAPSTIGDIADIESEESPHFYDIDGNQVSIDDFLGKPIVLLLWKSDNEKSYTMINLITKYYDSYKEKINFLTINVNELDLDLEIVENVKAANFKIPMYFDSDLEIIEEFQTEKFPYIAFYDAEGVSEKSFSESIDEDSLEANLDLLIKNY